MNRIYTVPAQYATIYQAEMLYKLGARIKSRLILVHQNRHMYLYLSAQPTSSRYLTIPYTLEAIATIEKDAKILEKIKRLHRGENGTVWYVLVIIRQGDPNQYRLKARSLTSLARVYLRFLITKIKQDVKNSQKTKKQARKPKKDNL